MLYPPGGSPTPVGFFSSKLENEGKPDQPREREDRQPYRVCHCTYSLGGGLYCSVCGTSAAARIVVLIIIVLLVVVRIDPGNISTTIRNVSESAVGNRNVKRDHPRARRPSTIASVSGTAREKTRPTFFRFCTKKICALWQPP
jgi:hypothetical protein